MKITDRFSREHDVFVKQLESLRIAVQNGADVGSAIERARTLAGPLLRHAENEEILLFPDLVEILGGAAGGMVSVLRQEHAIIHRQVSALTGEPAQAEFERVFTAFERLLRDHIAKEEDVLFPLSAKLLGDERLQEMDLQVEAAV